MVVEHPSVYRTHEQLCFGIQTFVCETGIYAAPVPDPRSINHTWPFLSLPVLVPNGGRVWGFRV